MSAEVPDIELVVTKLLPPVLRPVLAPRDRPLALLRAGQGCTLTLVGAPAGAGKTTAVAQWLAADAGRQSGCWFSVDRSDNDPTRFWSYVIMALREAIPGFGETSLTALRAAADVGTGVLTPMINELAASEAPVALVIDDYHLIANPEIHRRLEQLLEYLPAGVQVVVSTRADPPLPLSRWRGRGRLAELRAADLRFSEAEAAELFARMRIALEDDDVQRLVERTEGWAAGLSLAGLSIAGQEDTRAFVRAFAGTDRHVLDYLASEVLAGLDDDARRFLSLGSVLPRLSGGLCDFVLDRRGSARLLARLERSNAFVVPLGASREWYRLHHLVGELLYSELRAENPDLIPALHRRASRWFAREGMAFDAIDQAVQAGDTALVAELLGPRILAYAGSGQAETIEAWIERLGGEEGIAGEPHLCLAAAGACLVRGADAEMRRWIELAEQGPSPFESLRGGPASIAAGIATLGGVVTSGRLSDHLEAAQRAVELERDDPSAWHELASGALATALYWTGEPERARPHVDSVTRSSIPLLAATACGLLGMIAADLGDDEGAARAVAEGERIAAEHQLQESPPMGRVELARGRAAWHRGALGVAAAALEKAGELLREGPYPLERTDALLGLAQVRHALGDTGAARAALADARVVLASLPEPGILAERHRETERALAGRDNGAGPEQLSAREHEVLRMLPSTLSETEIGREMFISHHTVHSHVRTIYRKLGSSSRAQAVERARASGLLPHH